MAHIHMNTIATEYHDMVPHLRRAMDEPDYPTVGIEPPSAGLLAQCEIDSLRAELQYLRDKIAAIIGDIPDSESDTPLYDEIRNTEKTMGSDKVALTLYANMLEAVEESRTNMKRELAKLR